MIVEIGQQIPEFCSRNRNVEWCIEAGRVLAPLTVAVRWVVAAVCVCVWWGVVVCWLFVGWLREFHGAPCHLTSPQASRESLWALTLAWPTQDGSHYSMFEKRIGEVDSDVAILLIPS